MLHNKLDDEAQCRAKVKSMRDEAKNYIKVTFLNLLFYYHNIPMHLILIQLKFKVIANNFRRPY